MITAYRQKVKVKPGGQIVIRAPELETGTVAEVIILVEKQSTQKKRGRELTALFTTTQSLPEVQNISEEDIASEIEAYRKSRT